MSTVPFITRAQLEARISVKKVREIFDDNNDGTVDNDPITQILTDATSKVEAILEPIGALPAEGVTHNEIVRLTLDVAVALCAQRHPAVLRLDWKSLMEYADDELEKLREGITTLGPPPAPQPVNQGVTFVSGDASKGDIDKTERHWDDMGDY